MIASTQCGQIVYLYMVSSKRHYNHFCCTVVVTLKNTLKETVVFFLLNIFNYTFETSV